MEIIADGERIRELEYLFDIDFLILTSFACMFAYL